MMQMYADEETETMSPARTSPVAVVGTVAASLPLITDGPSASSASSADQMASRGALGWHVAAELIEARTTFGEDAGAELELGPFLIGLLEAAGR